MALPIYALSMIRDIIQTIKESNDSPMLRAVSLGYPDILASKDTVSDIFGEEIGKNVDYHADSESILRWHSATDITDGIPDSRQLFKLLGFELDVIDIVKARGDERIVDLNSQLPDDLYEQYDLLIDAGTIEHCFNIAQAMKNISQMMKQGGYIFQSNPLTCINHGFYNLNPTFYYDFYQENGFEIVFYEGVVSPVRNPKMFKMPAYKRIQGVPEEANNLVVVQRAEIKEIIWPIQTKYKRNSHLKG